MASVAIAYLEYPGNAVDWWDDVIPYVQFPEGVKVGGYIIAIDDD